MTAPAIESLNASSTESMLDALTSEDAIADVVKAEETKAPDKHDPRQTLHANTEPEKAEQPRDEATGKFKKPDAPVASADVKAKPTEEKAETPAEPVKLATEFSLYGKDGEELDPQDVVAKVAKVKFLHRGEEREYPLDRVIRLAKSGIHNEDLYTKATEAIGQFETLEQAVAKKDEAIAKQNTLIERLLSDDDYRATIREQYAQYNSPEARAERAEREARELREQLQGQSKADPVASFYQSDVRPRLEALLKEYPTLKAEDVVGRFNVMTGRFGQFKPHHLPELKAILVDELPAWAASKHEENERNTSSVRKAKEETTLLKRKLATSAKVIGRRVTPDDAKPKLKVARTEEQRLDNLMDVALADGMRE